MDQSKKRGDGSQLSSLSHSIKASIYQAEIGKQNGSSENFDFLENFLFPFIAETNRTIHEKAFLNLFMTFICVLQIIFSTFFDTTRQDVIEGINIVGQILFAGLDHYQEHRLTFNIVMTVIDLVFILLFTYSYISFRISFEFNKLSRYILKFLFGNVIIYTAIPNLAFAFSTLSAIGLDPSAANIIFFIVSVLLNIIMFMFYECVAIPTILSPYISSTSVYLWNPSKIVHLVYFFAGSFGISHFFEHFNRWYEVIPPILAIIGSLFAIFIGWTLHPKSKAICVLLLSLGVTLIVSSIISMAHVFVDISPYIRYIVPFAVGFLSVAVTLPLSQRKRNKLISQLSYEAIVDQDLTNEDAKADYFDTLNINGYNKAFTYLIIGLEHASPLFLDFSLTRYLIKKFPEDNNLLIAQTWFVSFFPNEQMTMHTLITLVNKMVKPTMLQRILRYQLHRVHIFRQSSASKEANADLNKVKQLTDSVINENCKFWSNAALPHTDLKDDFHLKLTSIRQKAEAGWAEIIDKYPNNARFASEYSRFLIEGTCNFKEGVRWYHKAIKIESGKKRETDRLFKTFVASYPFYLKKGIVGMNGDIRIKRVMQNPDGTNASVDNTNQTTSTSSSSKSLPSSDRSSNQEDDDSSAFDPIESEKALPQAPLRLAFEAAVTAMKSKVIINTTISAVVKLVISLVLSIIVFIFLYPIFDETSINFAHYTKLNDVEHITTIVADQVFWFIVDGLEKFNANTIKGYIGPNMSITPTYTNLYQTSMTHTVANLTAIMNDRMDKMALDIYLTSLSNSKAEDIITDFLTNTPYPSVTCSGSDSTGYTPTVNEDAINFDGLFRSFLIRGERLGSTETASEPSPAMGTAVLNSKGFCEFYSYYDMLQDAFDDFTKNRSVLYGTEIDHYLNTENPTSIFMGDETTNFSPEEEEKIRNADSIKIDESVTDTSNVFIAFIPFVLLIFAMPAVIFLSSVLSTETKQFTNVLLSMPSDVCIEASGRIQKNIIQNGKSGSLLTSANSTTSFPYFLISLVDSLLLIVILIISACYAQSIDTKLNTYQMHYLLFMEQRNSIMESAYLMQLQIFSNLLEKGQITFDPSTTTLPYIDSAYIKEKYAMTKKRTSMLQGIVDIGDDSFDSALGISNEIDSERFDPRCDQVYDTEFSVDYYRCLSFDRACAFFTSRLAEMEMSLDTLTLQSPDLYNLAFLVNSRIMTGFDSLMNRYDQLFNNQLDNFHMIVIIFFIVAIVVAFISFFVELGILTSIRQMFTSLHTLILRVNPIHFVQNQTALSFLVGKNNSEETHITSAAHAVFFTSADAMLLLNNDGIIEKLNPATTAIFHFTPEQMLGQHSTIIIPKDSPKNQQLYYTMQLMASGQCGLVFETELDGIRDDGVKVPIKATMIGFSSNQRNAEIFAIMCKDQTEEMKQKEAVEIAKKQSDELLLKILPPDIIRRINRGEKDITMVVPSASVIFIDICQFSAYMATLSASQLMSNLNAVFTAYDKIVADLPLITKIKLIGDDYMAAAGLFSPDEPPKMHAIQTITFGLRVLDAIEDLNDQLNASLAVRIGVNSGGPIIAGVLGTEKPLFDIIGDTINVAARLQSTCIPGNVQISKGTYELVAQESRFHIEERGEIFLKGKGNQTTYLVTHQGKHSRISYKDINLPPALQQEVDKATHPQQNQEGEQPPEPVQTQQQPETNPKPTTSKPKPTK